MKYNFKRLAYFDPTFYLVKVTPLTLASVLQPVSPNQPYCGHLRWCPRHTNAFSVQCVSVGLSVHWFISIQQFCEVLDGAWPWYQTKGSLIRQTYPSWISCSKSPGPRTWYKGNKGDAKRNLNHSAWERTNTVALHPTETDPQGV